MKEKIVFLGTPEFAATILEGLITANYNVIAVISQPDKPVGRKKIISPTPVKSVALKYNIPIFQPVSLRKDYDFLKSFDIDMLITAAYGQILPKEVLAMAKINAINVHGSLLPKYRGGAPIQRAIINGEKVTGITIMQMVEKMDAGEMYAQEEVTITNNINSTDLFKIMAQKGKDLLLKVLDDLLLKKIIGKPQNEDEVTYAYNLKKDEEKIDFNQDVFKVHNLIRGLSLNPGAYCLFKNKNLKIYESLVYESNVTDDALIGSLKIVAKNHLLVRCLNGYLEIIKLQVEGKEQMLASAFLNGQNKNELLKERLI